MKTSITQNKIYQIISIAIFIIIWYMLSEIADNSIKIPSPKETFIELIKIVTDENFFIRIFSTIKRVFISFFVAFSLGLILGMVAGFSNLFLELLKPLVLVLKSAPTMAVILLSLIWLGREFSPILVSFLICFPIIYSTTIEGIRGIDKKLTEMTQVFNVNKKKNLFCLYLPSIHSALLAISATAFSLNFKVCIAAEVLSQPKYSMGTGFLIEKTSLNTAGVLAWTIITIFLTGVFEYIIKKIFKNKTDIF